MHDIAFIRQNKDAFDAGLARRRLEPVADAILALDAKRREAQTTLQAMQNRRNEASKAIGQAMGQGDRDKAEALKAEVAEIKAQMPEWEEQERKTGEELEAILATLPNIPAEDVPEGEDENGNVVKSEWGTPRKFDFTPKEHADLGPALGMDFETGAKLSGARFTFLRGDMARLHRALAQFMLDTQTRTNGYTECNPPVLVNDAAMYGTDKLPKFAEDSFSILNDFKKMQLQADERAASVIKFLEFFDKVSSINSGFNDVIKAKLKSKNDLMGFEKVLSNFNEYYNDVSIELNKYQNQKKQEEAKLEELRKRKQDQSLWLIPTSEVSLTASVAGQILPALAEPIRMTAHTLCFRSEAGAAGKDTRGFIRQHQFEKVELVSICAPQDSEAEHERMTRCAEGILEALDLPYRKILLCTGDMGFGARKTYDLEVWLPGQGAYREISSCSNTGDFQARRMNARYRPEGSKKTEFVHTLNGSGLAVGRTLVAVLENYQQADGSVTVPQVLAPYMGGIDKLEPQ